MATETTPPEPDLPIVHKLLSRRPFWPLFGWGSAACIALAAAAITSQSGVGNKRLQVALVDRGKPTHVVAAIPRAAEPIGETQRLAAQGCASSPPTVSGSPPASPCSSTLSRT